MLKSIINVKSGYNIKAFDFKNKVHNFSPGPAQIPQCVLSSVSDDLSKKSETYKHGITPAEMSHRSPEFAEIKKSAEHELRKLMNIPSNFKILWTQGGGHGQFSAIPLNMIKTSNDNIKYIVTGTWSDRAYNEAKKFGNPIKLTNKKYGKLEDTLNFNEILDSLDIENQSNENDSYVYLCSNETVNGLEYKDKGLRLPKLKCPLVVDMSSDFLTKKVNWDNISVAFACTSKNLGMSGATITIIDEYILNKKRYHEGKIPSILDWKLFDKTDSLYNTPAIFNIYLIEKLLKFYNEKGIDQIENESYKKAKLLYDYLDKNSYFYKPFVNKNNENQRSYMNVPFYLCDESLMEDFLDFMYKKNIVGLRTKTPFKYEDIGMKEPLRISLYNGITIEDVKYLITNMEEFKNIHMKI